MTDLRGEWVCGSQEKLTAHWSVCERAAERKEVTHEDLRAVVARLLGADAGCLVDYSELSRDRRG